MGHSPWQRSHRQKDEAAAPRFSVRINRRNPLLYMQDAGVAQLVEHELPKLGVAGSNPVARSKFSIL